MKRKLLALLLALVMVLGLLPAALVPDTAVADGNNGDLAQETVQGGAILHCFNWSYNAIKAALPDIAAAGYTAVQTSPVQQPKDYSPVWTNTSGQWWKLYQPLGLRIAPLDNDGNATSWLGTKDELTALCAEADNYDIKVIVDIVSNHLGNIKDGGYTVGGESNLSSQVDEVFFSHPEYFHQIEDGINYNNNSDRFNLTQKHMGMPDLNTGNQDVQDMVYELLKECVDCGVDGFRFDAAKHIELPTDTGYDLDNNAWNGSDYWSDVLGRINSYRSGLFIYGEILDAPGTAVSNYTTYMAVTENQSGDDALGYANAQNAGGLAINTYAKGEQAADAVIWAESHDTYERSSNPTSTISSETIVKAWAIVGARADSTSLFLARPNATMGKASSDTTWKSKAVAEVNKFKNHYNGTSEYLDHQQANKVVYIERGNAGSGAGVVIDKLDGAGSVNLTAHLMSDGTYQDEVSGNIFTVANGKITGNVGPTGVAVVYKTATVTPSEYITADSIYFVPTGWWLDDNARFEMWLFNGNGGTFVSLTDADNDGIYEGALAPGNWTGVIFVRMNPNAAEHTWDSKWNQTDDLVPDVGKDCYTIIAPKGTTSFTGFWSKYDPGYYLVGNMNDWTVLPEYRLTENENSEESEEKEEYSIDVELTKDSQFKIVKSADGVTKSKWFPDPSDNYGQGSEIHAAGHYHVYFRPNYDGEDGWFQNCIYAEGFENTITVNIVGNSDLIEWSLYTSEGDMTLWRNGEEETTEVIKLENGDNVVPVGWHVGLEATTKNGINADFSYCVITFTDDVGGSNTANGGGDVGSRFRTYVGPLGEGPVTFTLTVGNTKPTFMTQSLTLGGEIGVNFYMNLSMLSDAEKASSYMTFEVGTENKKVVSKANYDATKTGENGTYGFTCYVNAIQMADPINATFHYTQNGEDKTVEKKNYNVRLYLISCQQEASVSQEVKDLAKSLINYGHFVQIYLAGIRNWTLNTDYMEIDLIDGDTVVYNYETVAAALDNAVYNSVRTNNTGGDIVENGITYSLVLDSKTAIRVYFRPKAGYNGAFTVTLDGVSYTPKTVGGRYLVEITGIAAHELGNKHIIQVTTANGSAHVEVSALTYVKDMLNAKTGTTEAETDAKNAVCAIYEYYKAADDYKKANPQ